MEESPNSFPVRFSRAEQIVGSLSFLARTRLTKRSGGIMDPGARDWSEKPLSPRRAMDRGHDTFVQCEDRDSELGVSSYGHLSIAVPRIGGALRSRKESKK